MGFYGILWDFLGFFGILWDFMGFYGILWDFWDFLGFFWDSNPKKSAFSPLKKSLIYLQR
jgi:hypothetical protein